jgi:hypothetical protein
VRIYTGAIFNWGYAFSARRNVPMNTTNFFPDISEKFMMDL